MEKDQDSDEEQFLFEEIVKKTKTGVTFPKALKGGSFNETVVLGFRRFPIL